MPARRKSTHAVNVDGAPMVYDLWEPAAPVDPTPIILVHGWGGSGRYWSSLVSLLGNKYIFLVPDLPGVARSLKVTRPRDLFDQVSALEALLDERGLDRVTVIGHSMGCSLAMLLHQRRPEAVERLILTSVGAPKDERERQAFERFTLWLGFLLWFRVPALAYFPPAVRRAGARYFYRLPDDPALLRAGFLDYLTMDFGAAYACARTAASPKILEAARAVRVP
ncbi:MAG: alpha/beta hydrolase, partial [Dehalococcoidia bacterium]|nr:alpha/beta hydrolase [Dehalococcoidia bacterium]